ncbi:hypothetical protein BR93DRAFT_202889 [Coniochaeta sp. PMI_546]|nr:hypothetical protein BR93DRAFT_202889 [Coniochaeta sp. PMI_546]
MRAWSPRKRVVLPLHTEGALRRPRLCSAVGDMVEWLLPANQCPINPVQAASTRDCLDNKDGKSFRRMSGAPSIHQRATGRYRPCNKLNRFPSDRHISAFFQIISGLKCKTSRPLWSSPYLTMSHLTYVRLTRYFPPGVKGIIATGGSCWIGEVDDSTVLNYPHEREDEAEAKRLHTEHKILSLLGQHPRIRVNPNPKRSRFSRATAFLWLSCLDSSL